MAGQSKLNNNKDNNTNNDKNNNNNKNNDNSNNNNNNYNHYNNNNNIYNNSNCNNNNYNNNNNNNYNNNNRKNLNSNRNNNNTQNTVDNLNIIQWNARSIRNSTLDLKLAVYTTKPHIVAIQETWLDNKDKDPIFISYDCIRADRWGGNRVDRGRVEGEDLC